MTDKPTDLQAPTLSSVLEYVFSREGLEQNLDISLNMTDAGQVALMVVASNANIQKAASSVMALTSALLETKNVTLTQNN